MRTVLVEVEEIFYEPNDYTTYVFKLVDSREIKWFDSLYMMCVKFPNWQHREIKEGEIGYLNYKQIEEGSTQWFDGKNMNYYRCTTLQFIKFIPKKEKSDKKNYIL